MADTADNIRFNALRNAIYHTSRSGFLNTLNRCLSFIVVAGGTGAVADVGRSLGVSPLWFAALAALGGLAQLVFDFGGKARTHEFLQRRFYEVVAEITECMAPGDGDCSKWEATLHRLYAEEPPPMRALDAIAYNAALDSLGRNRDGRIPISRWQSFLRQVWPFNETAF